MQGSADPHILPALATNSVVNATPYWMYGMSSGGGVVVITTGGSPSASSGAEDDACACAHGVAIIEASQIAAASGRVAHEDMRRE